MQIDRDGCAGFKNMLGICDKSGHWWHESIADGISAGLTNAASCDVLISDWRHVSLQLIQLPRTSGDAYSEIS